MKGCEYFLKQVFTVNSKESFDPEMFSYLNLKIKAHLHNCVVSS